MGSQKCYDFHLQRANNNSVDMNRSSAAFADKQTKNLTLDNPSLIAGFKIKFCSPLLL